VHLESTLGGISITVRNILDDNDALADRFLADVWDLALGMFATRTPYVRG